LERAESANIEDIGMCGWIGVDLDGTLAKSVKAQTGEEIGVPIHPMVPLVKVWLARGEDVRLRQITPKNFLLLFPTSLISRSECDRISGRESAERRYPMARVITF
jgi:hypothetical protein